MANPKARYEALDSLRGIAALSVAVFHLQVASHFYPTAYVRHSDLFVEFFFVLSGFVISNAYFGKLNTAESSISFIIRRFGRVYPMHIVTLGVMVAAELLVLLASPYIGQALSRQPFVEDRSVPLIFLNVFLLNGLGFIPGGSWNGPSWSISTEFFTYLIFAATCLLPRRLIKPAIFLLIATTAAIAIFVAPRYLMSIGVYRLNTCVLCFFTGYLVWQAKHLTTLPATVAQIVTGVGAVLYLCYLQDEIYSLLSPIIFGLTVYSFARSGGIVSSFLTKPFFLMLGRLSYSIYMVHFFFCYILTNAIKVTARLLHTSAVLPGTDLALIGNEWVMDAITILYLVAVVATASLTYQWIEMPGTSYFKSLADRRAAARGSKKTISTSEPTPL